MCSSDLFNRPGQVYNATDTKSILTNDEKVVQAIAELKAEMRAVVVTVGVAVALNFWR